MARHVAQPATGALAHQKAVQMISDDISTLTPLLDDRAVAALLGCSRFALQAGRQGKGELRTLPWIKVGRLARYEPRAVQAWLDERRVVPAP